GFTGSQTEIAIVIRSGHQESSRPEGGDQRPGGVAQGIARQEKDHGQSGKDGESLLNQQVNQGMVERNGQQGDQRPRMVTSPKEGSPPVQTGQHQDNRIGMMALVETAEVDPKRYQGA